ncbi:hypothetical protein FOL47_005898 [Perkinsus chesapeaki]|uniref:Pseudouridine-5'-phosphatase n=1 Tax=Perkinsus chesapeaki TaxID=330153 RepID=A0A7J6LUY7_PERCH|nr:hypothetical protein FOL47_005898 [Perkinsus chesapeaki]
MSTTTATAVAPTTDTSVLPVERPEAFFIENPDGSITSIASNNKRIVEPPPQPRLECYRCHTLLEFAPHATYVQCPRCNSMNSVTTQPAPSGNGVLMGARTINMICSVCHVSNLAPWGTQYIRVHLNSARPKPSFPVNRYLMVQSSSTASDLPAFIFDVDGTLIDYEGASAIALSKPIEKFGGKVTPALHAKLMGTQPEDWSRIVLDGNGITPEQLPRKEYIKQYYECMDTLYDTLELMPGAAHIMDDLEKYNPKRAVATSSISPSFEKKVNHLPQIKECFPVCVCGDDPNVKHGKPAPDIFLEAARRLDADPKDCVVFEDSAQGVQAALAAGMRVVAIPDKRFQCPEVNHSATYNEATWVLDSLADIHDLKEFFTSSKEA